MNKLQLPLYYAYYLFIYLCAQAHVQGQTRTDNFQHSALSFHYGGGGLSQASNSAQQAGQQAPSPRAIAPAAMPTQS